MTEKVCLFGPDSCLLGILAEPEPGMAVPGAPAILLWNVGINHRVGPFRIFVDLARSLSATGFPVLRFDASGLGDSEVRRDRVSDAVRARSDLHDAMNFLESRGVANQFVLVGFCSSVDTAYEVAIVDPRVTGVAFLEAYTFRTAGFYRRYLLRLLSRVRWRRYLHQRFKRLFGRRAAPTRTTGEREEVYLRDRPSRERFSADLRALAERGTKLLFLYVAGDSEYLYLEQFYEMFGENLRGKVELEFWPRADHTFFRVADRLRAIERLRSWVANGWARARGEGAPTAPA